MIICFTIGRRCANSILGLVSQDHSLQLSFDYRFFVFIVIMSWIISSISHTELRVEAYYRRHLHLSYHVIVQPFFVSLLVWLIDTLPSCIIYMFCGCTKSCNWMIIICPKRNSITCKIAFNNIWLPLSKWVTVYVLDIITDMCKLKGKLESFLRS